MTVDRSLELASLQVYGSSTLFGAAAGDGSGGIVVCCKYETANAGSMNPTSERPSTGTAPNSSAKIDGSTNPMAGQARRLYADLTNDCQPT